VVAITTGGDASTPVCVSGVMADPARVANAGAGIPAGIAGAGRGVAGGDGGVAVSVEDIADSATVTARGGGGAGGAATGLLGSV